MSKLRFPQLIHITLDELANDDPCLIVNEGGPLAISDEHDGKPVAIYTLVEIRRFHVTKRLSEKKIPNR